MQQVFDGVTQANTNPTLEKVDEIESPKRAAQDDAIFLNAKLFQRVAAVYKQMDSLGLDPGVAAAGGGRTTSTSCTRARTSPTPTRRS